MAEATTNNLRLVCQGVFSPPADSLDRVAACPTIELTATTGGGNAVYVRRRGGEIVSKLTERNKQVQAVAWRADGQFLAVAWSDGIVRLVGLESSKAVHQFRLPDGASSAPVTFLSWPKNRVGRPESWQISLLDSCADEGDTQAMLDLPDALMFLEVEDDLPKLPPLPVSGGSGDDMFVFSTRTTLEFMFPPFRPRDGDSIHLMVLGTADGAIHVSIYDTFILGTFRVSAPSRSASTVQQSEAALPSLRLHRHVSCPASSTHILLLGREDADDFSVYLAPMDFAFVFSSPLNLSLLSFKITTFQKLLRYIKQTYSHMQGEWQTARGLPARYLAGIQEDLKKERRHKSIDHALRVAAMTGFVSPTLKEWLVDTITERGHKRWDKAVVSGLESLRDLIHDNMMPALDRAALALSRLRGLAEFHSDDDVGITEPPLAQLLDMVSCLITVCHSTLALVTAELQLFVAFSTWLKSLIERLAFPAQAEEREEKDTVFAATPVLDYITHHLVTSPIELHMGKASDADWKADRAVVQANLGGLFDKLEAELEKISNYGMEEDKVAMLKKPPSRLRSHAAAVAAGKHKAMAADKQPAGKEEADEELETDADADETYMKAFPKLDFLVQVFSDHADRVLCEIAKSGRRHVHFGPLTRLHVGVPIHKSEVAMTALPKADQEDSPDALAFTAVALTEHKQTLFVFRTSISTSEGVTTAVSTQALSFACSGDGVIKDFLFLGADAVLVLWSWSAKERPPRLVAIPVQSPATRYQDYDADRGMADVATMTIHHDRIHHLEGGLLVDGSCWAADVPLLQEASEHDETLLGAKGAKGAKSPVVRMQLVGWSGEMDNIDGSGTAFGAADGTRDEQGKSAARVCLMHADGSSHRVFALPSVAAMFG